MSEGGVDVLERPKGEVKQDAQPTPKPDVPQELNGKSTIGEHSYGVMEGLVALHGQTDIKKADDTHKEGAVGEFTTNHQGKDVKVTTYTNKEGIATAAVEVSSKEEDAYAIRLELQKEYREADHGMDTLSTEHIMKAQGDVGDLEKVDKILTSVSQEANK
jgi:hypothetical protein